MNRLLFITATILLTNFVFGQQSNLDPKLIRKNKVKEVTSTIHIYKTTLFPDMNEFKGKSQLERYDTNGNLIYLVTYDTNGKPRIKLWYQYDTYGNKTQEKGINHLTGIADSIKYVLTYKNDKLLKEESTDTLYRVEYSYNDKGQLIKESNHNRMMNPPESPIMYSYDDKGNMSDLFRLDGDFKIHEYFKYDEQNRKTEHKQIYVDTQSDTSGRIFLWEKFHYDKNGNLLQVENIGDYGGTPTSTYTYDNNGYLATKQNFLTQYEYINDKNGNRIKEVLKSDGNIISETDYTYIFW
jgi:hypothetical protein